MLRIIKIAYFNDYSTLCKLFFSVLYKSLTNLPNLEFCEERQRMHLFYFHPYAISG